MMWKPLHLLLLSVPLAESFLIHSPCSASSKLVGCAGAAAVSAEATPETSTSSARTHDGMSGQRSEDDERVQQVDSIGLF